MDYDVAILGGGVIGWSVALNVLRVAPALQVAVFEKEPTFGMGSTGRAAGGVRAQFGTPINVDLSLYSIRQFEELAARGNDIGFKQYGYLFVASTEPTDSYLDAVVGMQQERGVPVRRLTGSEVATIAPYLNCTDIISGSVSWSDGYLDPYAVCQAFERQARELGAKAPYSTEVLSGAPGRVETSVGDFEAQVVVIACGHWSSAVANIFGVDLPVAAEKHQLAMTDSAAGLPEELPMVVDLATSFHFRREGRGLLIGFNDPEADMTGSNDAFDYGFLERMAEVGLHRLPLLESVGFDTKKCWGGFYAETPDRHAIIDRIGNTVICSGFGGHGIMHSPAAGRAAAELVVAGACETFDLHALRLARFAEGEMTVEPMVI